MRQQDKLRQVQTADRSLKLTDNDKNMMDLY